MGKAIYPGTNPPPLPLPYMVLSREKAVSECLPVVSSTASLSVALVFKRANEAKDGLQGPVCVTKGRVGASLPVALNHKRLFWLDYERPARAHPLAHSPAAEDAAEDAAAAQTSFKYSRAATR